MLCAIGEANVIRHGADEVSITCYGWVLSVCRPHPAPPQHPLPVRWFCIQLPLKDFPSQDYWPSGLILVAYVGLQHFPSFRFVPSLQRNALVWSSLLWGVWQGEFPESHMGMERPPPPSPQPSHHLHVEWISSLTWMSLWLCSTGERINDEHFSDRLAWTFLITNFKSPRKPGAMASSLWKLHTFCWFLITLAQVHSTEGKYERRRRLCFLSKTRPICSRARISIRSRWTSIVSVSVASAPEKSFSFSAIVLFRSMAWTLKSWLKPKLLLWVQPVLV